MLYDTFMDQFERFASVWRRLTGVDGSPAVFDALLTAYSEPQRVYHSTAHLRDCLKQFDTVRHLAKDDAALEVAIWFHDAVYDPRGADNEERSAEWAERELSACNAPSGAIAQVRKLILATKHQVPPDDRDTELLLDIDLSILGRDPAVFDAYDAAIREEYQFVPEEQFREARARILSGFLNREFIYHTTDFRRLYEQQARENLRRIIAVLRRQ